jgi:Tol biopolymer transport system component
MTSDDRFDRRFAAGVADLAVPQFPDYFDDVLAESGRTRQRPAWTFPGRWIPMVDITQGRAMAPRMPWRVVGIVVAVLLLLAALAAAYVGSQRHLPAPFGVARNGLVAHVEGGDIYVTDPTTGGSRVLIHDALAQPVFSLDGTRLAFLRGTAEATDVYVADADGSHLAKITARPLDNVDRLAWSPDGRSIAIDAGGAPEASRLLVAQADGGGVSELDLGTPASEPAWRPPDGRDLLFRGIRDDQPALFLVHPDGTDLRFLGAPGAEDRYDLSMAAWSPDGSRIAYVLDKQDPYQARVHAINADGTGHVVLSVAPEGIQDYSPVWSPDGHRIAVFRWQNVSGNAHLWVAILPSDGSSPGVDADNLLSAARQPNEWRVTWSPDGKQLIAQSQLTEGVVSIDPTTGASAALPWTTPELPTWQRLAP